MDFKNVIQHVLDCYDNDTEWLAHDKKAAGGAAAMVMAGCFLCYYSEIREWWESNGGEHIEDDEDLWMVYTNAVASAVREIVSHPWRY